MKIAEAFDAYERNYMRVKNYSQSTIQHFRFHRNSAMEFFQGRPLESLTEEDVARWAKWLGKKRCSNTVKDYVGNLRQVLGYHQIRGVDCLNPALIPLPKRIDRPVAFLTEEEVRAMIDCSSDIRAKLVISLFFASGIRLSELISLDRGQIQERRFTIQGKGGKIRLCFIDERTERLMDEYLKRRTDNNSALIISYRYKKRMTPTNIQLLVKNAARRAGIRKNVSPHTLRHSFATYMLQNGVDVRYIKEMLGHSSLTTTMRYTHVADPDLECHYRKVRK